MRRLSLRRRRPGWASAIVVAMAAATWGCVMEGHAEGERRASRDGTEARAVSGGAGQAADSLPYRLHAPDGVGPSSPLLVVLHGCTQDAEEVAAATRFDALADRGRFLVLYPEQRPEAHPQRCWRWFDAEHRMRGSGEPGALLDLVARVIRDRPVDPERVYLAGISAGAGMAVVLAALHPERFAGVAAHSGVPYDAADDEQEAAVVLQGGGPSVEVLARRLEEEVPDGTSLPPLLAIHGTADSLVSPANTRRLVSAWLMASSGSAPEPDREARGTGGDGDYPYVRRGWGPEERPRAEQWLVDRLGHAWSGGSPEGTWSDPAGPDASSILLAFFGLPTDGE